MTMKKTLSYVGIALFVLLWAVPIAFGQSAPPSGSSSSGTTYVSVADGGVVVDSTTIACAPASATGTGCVNTTTQTFAGDKTLSGVLLSSAGTAAAPGIAWSADSDGTGTGLYRSGANEVSVALNGVRAIRIQGSSPCIYGDSNSSAVCLNSSVGSQLFYSGNAVTVDGSNVTISGVSLRTTLGLRLNTSGGGSKPACDSTVRGLTWYVQGAGGVADTIEICGKSAADAYAWLALATFP